MSSTSNEKNVIQQSRVFGGTANAGKATLPPPLKEVRDHALKMVSTNPASHPPIEMLLSLPAVISFVNSQYIKCISIHSSFSFSSSFSSSSSSTSSVLTEENKQLQEKVSRLENEVSELKRKSRSSSLSSFPLVYSSAASSSSSAVVCSSSSLSSFPPVSSSAVSSSAPTVISFPLKFRPRKVASKNVTNTQNMLVWNSDGWDSFFVDPEINEGIYKIAIEGSGGSDFGGFCVGLVDKTALVDLEGYLERKWSSGDKVTLEMELDADKHVLFFFVNKIQLPLCIVNVPAGVHFEVTGYYGGLSVELRSLVKLTAPTVNTSTLPFVQYSI